MLQKAIPRASAQRIKNDAHAIQVATELMPQLAAQAKERDQLRRAPVDELDLLSSSGLLAITIPKEYGGAGVSASTLAEVGALISQADPSIGQIPQNHFYAVELLRLIGSAAQKMFYFSAVLEGKRFGSAFAERGTRTSAAGDRQTRLSGDAGNLRIDGQKFYCTGASYADWISVFVKTESGDQKVAFVPRDEEGVSIRNDWSGIGQRTTASGTTLLVNVAVSEAQVVPFQNVFLTPSRLGPYSQLYHASIDLGIARAALVDFSDFVRTRSRPWIDSCKEKACEDPLTLQDYGRLMIDLHMAEALMEEAAAQVDCCQHEPDDHAVGAASIAVAQLRIATNDVALAASSKLLEHAGAQATLAQFGLDRHWRNARTHTLHDPVRWKAPAIGNYYLNHQLPPRRGSL